MKEGRLVKDFLVLPQGSGSFPSVIPQARRCNLVGAECLQMINELLWVVAVGFENNGQFQDGKNTSQNQILTPKIHALFTFYFKF